MCGVWSQDKHLFCSSPPTLFVPLPFTAETERERKEKREQGLGGGVVEVNIRWGDEAEELRGGRGKWKSLGVSLKKR